MITKLDVLSGFETLKLCVGYRSGEKEVAVPPYSGLDDVEPIYEELPGWGDDDISECRSVASLPRAAQKYLERIGELAECKIGLVSVGPGRKQSIGVDDPFS